MITCIQEMAQRNPNMRARRFCRVQILWCVAVSALFATGCSHRFIVFTTGTSIGIEATAEEGAEQRLLFGYKRFEAAVIPTRDEQGNLRKEAYSVYAGLGLNTVGGFDTTLNQVFATGIAARSLAGSKDGLAKLVRVSAEDLGEEARTGEGPASYAVLAGDTADLWAEMRRSASEPALGAALAAIRDALAAPELRAEDAATRIRKLDSEQLGRTELEALHTALQQIANGS